MGFTHLQIEWNPWLGGYRPQISVLSALCPQLNLLNSVGISAMIGCTFVMSWGLVLLRHWLWKLAADPVVLLDVVGGTAQCGTGQRRQWISSKLNVESGVASAKQWCARSTQGSVAGLSDVVAALLMYLQRCVLLDVYNIWVYIINITYYNLSTGVYCALSYMFQPLYLAIFRHKYKDVYSFMNERWINVGCGFGRSIILSSCYFAGLLLVSWQSRGGEACRLLADSLGCCDVERSLVRSAEQILVRETERERERELLWR
jgi:hypothetical protein